MAVVSIPHQNAPSHVVLCRDMSFVLITRWPNVRMRALPRAFMVVLQSFEGAASLSVFFDLFAPSSSLLKNQGCRAAAQT